jgi:hypothetical protein
MRRTTRLGLFLRCAGLAVLLPALAATAQAAGTIHYTNQKYGFSLSLPGDVFEPGSARNPEEGGLWLSKDGQSRVLAVAAFNTSGDTLEGYRSFVMQQTYKDAVFDYTPVRDNWFVLSGRLGDVIFYERINFVCDGRYIYGWQMFYPAAEKRRYDRIAEAIHRSYRIGRGEDGRCGPGASANAGGDAR